MLNGSIAKKKSFLEVSEFQKCFFLIIKKCFSNKELPISKVTQGVYTINLTMMGKSLTVFLCK